MTFDQAIGIAEEWLTGNRLASDPLLNEALDHVEAMSERLENLALLLDQRRLASAFRGGDVPQTSS